MNSISFDDALYSALEALGPSGRSTQAVREFATRLVGADVVDAITAQLDRAQWNEEAIRGAMRSGLSRAAWLGLGAGLTSDDDVPVDLPGSVQALFGLVTDPSTKFSAGQIGAGILRAAIAPLSSALGGVTGEAEGGDPWSRLQFVADAVLSPYDGASERDLVVAVASVLISRDVEGVKPETIVAGVDLAVRVAKVGYRLANDEIDVDEAVSEIADRFAAQIGAIAAAAVTAGGALIGAALGSAVESVLPAGGMIIQGARFIGRACGESVREQVEGGVKRAVGELAGLLGTVAQRGMAEAGRLLSSVFG